MLRWLDISVAATAKFWSVACGSQEGITDLFIVLSVFCREDVQYCSEVARKEAGKADGLMLWRYPSEIAVCLIALEIPVEGLFLRPIRCRWRKETPCSSLGIFSCWRRGSRSRRKACHLLMVLILLSLKCKCSLVVLLLFLGFKVPFLLFSLLSTTVVALLLHSFLQVFSILSGGCFVPEFESLSLEGVNVNGVLGEGYGKLHSNNKQ